MRILRLISAALFCLMLAGCGRAVLFADLDEHQANQVEAALLAADVDAEKVLADNKKGWKILVESADFPHAVEVLRARGLPTDSFDTLGSVFKKEGFVSSPLEERARYLYALSQELAHTLEQIDGVVSARVHIALPQHDPLDHDDKSASASVVIIEQPGSKVRERETDIKAIVTDSVEGLDDINKVTVKFFTREQAEAPAPAKNTPQNASLIPLSSRQVHALTPAIGAGAALVLFGVLAWLLRDFARGVFARAKSTMKPKDGRDD
jgi:type III secretion protein J